MRFFGARNLGVLISASSISKWKLPWLFFNDSLRIKVNFKGISVICGLVLPNLPLAEIKQNGRILRCSVPLSSLGEGDLSLAWGQA